MVVSARSKGPLGPWENSPYNPIIRTWDRDEAWWSKGHGTLVEGPGENWYCVLHGYMNGYRTLGRCTLIEPIEWTDDGWFRAADSTGDGCIQHDHRRLARLAPGAVFDGHGKDAILILPLPVARLDSPIGGNRIELARLWHRMIVNFVQGSTWLRTATYFTGINT
jgi:hypothetical protein